MKHLLTEQLATMRLRSRHTDALLFVMAVAAGLTLLVIAVLRAPIGWNPL